MKNTEFIIRKRSGAHKPTAKEVRNWKENNAADMTNASPSLLLSTYFTTWLDFICLQDQPCQDSEQLLPEWPVCVDLWAAMNFRDVWVTVDPWDGTQISSSFLSWFGSWHSAKLSPIFSSLSHFEVWFLFDPFLAAAWNLVPTGRSSRQHTLLFFS